ncbi:MAG: DUF1932 domain-containing protein [Sphingomicrobium sp.]
MEWTTIGFGEAGAALAGGIGARGYDRKLDGAERAAKLTEFEHDGVMVCDTVRHALVAAQAVFSLVTADEALAAANEAAASIERGALFFDMNSVAPATKHAAAAAIESAGGRYVDAAVMAPVFPKRRDVPVLLSGPHAEAGAEALRTIGFGDVTIFPGPVGTASSIKMIRSVMVKGLEALTAECALAAEAAGVREAVFGSLDASWSKASWSERADYNLERIMVHGLRRAAEMEEVVKTLDALGTGSAMARATVERQREIGGRGIVPADGLVAKLGALLDRNEEQAA